MTALWNAKPDDPRVQRDDRPPPDECRSGHQQECIDNQRDP